MELEGFEEKTVGAEGASELHVALDFGAGQNDDWEALELRLAADPAEDIEAAGLGKTQVEQDEGRELAGFGKGEEFQGRCRIVEDFNAVRDAGVFTCGLKEEGKIAIIFYQQNVRYVVHHSFVQSLI
jgi:hypothetical protein